MSIELLVVVVVVLAGVAVWYFNRSAKTTDLNSDGKTDVKDVLVAVENTVSGVKAAADLNKDGKVNSGDAKVVVKKAKTTAKKAAAKVKETATKKPRAKKKQ